MRTSDAGPGGQRARYRGQCLCSDAARRPCRRPPAREPRALWARPAPGRHPRLFLTPDVMARVKRKAAARDPDWLDLLGRADRFVASPVAPYDRNEAPRGAIAYSYQGAGWLDAILPLGVAYNVTGQETYARKVAEIVRLANATAAAGNLEPISTDAGFPSRTAALGLALAFDWIYGALTPADRACHRGDPQSLVRLARGERLRTRWSGDRQLFRRAPARLRRRRLRNRRRQRSRARDHRLRGTALSDGGSTGVRRTGRSRAASPSKATCTAPITISAPAAVRADGGRAVGAETGARARRRRARSRDNLICMRSSRTTGRCRRRPPTRARPPACWRWACRSF